MHFEDIPHHIEDIHGFVVIVDRPRGIIVAEINTQLDFRKNVFSRIFIDPLFPIVLFFGRCTNTSFLIFIFSFWSKMMTSGRRGLTQEYRECR